MLAIRGSNCSEYIYRTTVLPNTVELFGMHKLLLASGAQTGYHNVRPFGILRDFGRMYSGNNFTPLKYQIEGTIGKVENLRHN